MKKYFQIAVLLAMVAMMGGCATPARVDQMTVEGQPSQRIAATPFRNHLMVRDVTGGQETNPMWRSSIGSNEFRQALEGSLRAVGLLSLDPNSRYLLTAHLEKVDQPFAGFDMTVTASVRYTVSERATGKEVFGRTVAVPYTASFGDSLLGAERLKLANEGAVRANITQLIDELFRSNIQNVSIK